MVKNQVSSKTFKLNTDDFSVLKDKNDILSYEIYARRNISIINLKPKENSIFLKEKINFKKPLQNLI
jgi:hypothetical protein